jgi:hypothetical protein
VLIENDTMEMERIKGNLTIEFEMKDLDALRYILDIEVARSPKRVFLSQ